MAEQNAQNQVRLYVFIILSRLYHNTAEHIMIKRKQNKNILIKQLCIHLFGGMCSFDLF